MQAIINAQGKNSQSPRVGRLRHELVASHSGFVTSINNLQLARIARLAGAPLDQGAGVELHCKLGDRVEAGKPLYTIYAEFPADFDFAREASEEESGYAIGEHYVDEVP